MIEAMVVILIVVLICIIIVQRESSKKLIRNINSMLDSAIFDTFDEKLYDETCLSQLEVKLNRFLKKSKSVQNSLEKEKGRIETLISDISHQTKTPISNILLYSQLLEEQKQANGDSDNLRNQIVLQSEKLSFLIQSLVKVSRLENGIISISPKQSSINQLIENVIDSCATKADKKNIALDYILPPEDKSACFDSKWTEEAIYNILDNAIKYTPCGGAVTVKVTEYELFIRINISDTGIGIPEQEINEIFKRFYRGKALTEYEGIGIGLYISREIITNQGGYIKVESEISKGSTFSIFLPKKLWQ